jgi:protease-4
MTDEERALLQQMVDRLHDQFVADLAKARNLEEKKVDDYADGRIILGQDALRLGLVDRLGNFEDALDLAARLGDISGRPNIVQEEEEFSWLSFIFGGRNPLSGWAYRVSDRSESPLRFQYLYHPGL